MFKPIIEKVIYGKNLSAAEAEYVMNKILKGELSSVQMAGILTALSAKGETTEEILAFVRVMRSHGNKVNCTDNTVDTCGTGGDGSMTFNISTASAFVTAGAGVHVAKHGNRSVSSRCGSADVLEALGVNIELSPQQAEMALKTTGMAFLFAPFFHPAVRHVQGARRELGVKTVFNILGPLANPAGAAGQVIGVYSPALVPKLAKVLLALGVERAFVVHGEGGMDEVTLSGTTKVAYVHDGKIDYFTISPEDFGFQRSEEKVFLGGDAMDNAQIIRKILAGEQGPKRDIVVLNAALALVAGKAAETIGDGLHLAKRSIDSGRAADILLEAIRFSNNFAPYTKVS